MIMDEVYLFIYRD